jgi:hypothetical protein
MEDMRTCDTVATLAPSNLLHLIHEAEMMLGNRYLKHVQIFAKVVSCRQQNDNMAAVGNFIQLSV